MEFYLEPTRWGALLIPFLPNHIIQIKKIIDHLNYLVGLLQQSIQSVRDFQRKFPLQNGLLKFRILNVLLVTLMEEEKSGDKKIPAMT